MKCLECPGCVRPPSSPTRPAARVRRRVAAARQAAARVVSREASDAWRWQALKLRLRTMRASACVSGASASCMASSAGCVAKPLPQDCAGCAECEVKAQQLVFAQATTHRPAGEGRASAATGDACCGGADGDGCRGEGPGVAAALALSVRAPNAGASCACRYALLARTAAAGGGCGAPTSAGVSSSGPSRASASHAGSAPSTARCAGVTYARRATSAREQMSV